jgi:hypothetical protein
MKGSRSKVLKREAIKTNEEVNYVIMLMFVPQPLLYPLCFVKWEQKPAGS